MKANELMVGDWVYNKHHKKNIQITPYDFFTHGHLPSGRQYFIGEPELVSGRDLEPIPLTPEILEKNGFVEHDTWNEWVHYTDGIFIDFTLLVGEDDFHLDIPNTRIKYVHQLQHALRLCGIEKTIEL